MVGLRLDCRPDMDDQDSFGNWNVHFASLAVCFSRVWRIYLNIWIFLIWIFIRIFVRIFFGCKYIRIFVRINFLDTNIFGYSFVSTFWIRIHSDIRSRQDFYSNIFGYSFVSIFRTQTDSEDVFVDFLWILYFAYG